MSDDPRALELQGPAPLRLRRPVDGDVANVAALHAAAESARGGTPHTREEDVRIRWLGLDGPQDVVLVEHPDARPPLIGVGEFAVDLDLLDEATVVHVEGQVHPDWTGRGVASLLLERAEGRARAAASATGAETAVVRTTVTDGDDRARDWFARRGFLPVRHLLEMHLDLDRVPPAPTWPDGVRVRTFRLGRDEARAWAAHVAAFDDVPTHLPLTLEEWVEDRVLRDPSFEPSLTFLAVAEDDAVIGLAVCRAGADGAPEDGFVRDLGVVPAWRGRGLGMALLLHALRTFHARGLTGAALEVDDVTIGAAVRLYERAGMRITRRIDVLERLVGRHG